uniref:Nitrogenase/oxidoreductase component 1 domain-containing protein n=1 Tax=Candidatus Methanogaster sp. ANME-2c ERB4 TaxID=2759911 RepID=A0A7G9Y869_9EURY|nr:hypothetical protein EBGJIAFC_00003 [Methanosarcinales archaeon ANME-2c ERB4]QNO44088.1 hypothetical protein AFMMMMLI_00002 [Methanosarcinales archaeon ANME-2c ERB4]QNO44203.1 hypothetical protein DHFCJGNJ_00011 [Methanosarcinales archaeon ANME-2c ERB4]QNO46506.1 hypothetical protein IOLGBOFK_00003 [Methanosarcinales archaeon ANME-2c ERB4]
MDDYVCAGVHNGAGFRPRGLHKSVKRVDVDLLMANSHGKYITDDEGLAFARVGFLVYDRVGYQRRAIIGYGGGIDLVDVIADAILDHADA